METKYPYPLVWQIGDPYPRIGSAVYLLQIGEDTYVGETANLRNRIKQHWYNLKSNRHCLKALQESFNNHKDVKCYFLESLEWLPRNNTRGNTIAEWKWIQHIKPTLNKSPLSKILWDKFEQKTEMKIDMDCIEIYPKRKQIL